ncbi:kinase-like domain-containing protein [Yarrowia lipolytica]|nr:Serine/threonine-protein kinase ENV7 [Yarrowia lipolytica]RDW31773.1 kinase-like domain-containing protein [Yarrowia lipolytica]RDW38560.1 kinase-like domain-containing protein [Yarrowia lipolytica]RDW47837.1 kinase-like domain-containing protein [Yarrowia lipolytica]RDW55056.1 kinase-like domain-containing protein [Yarrowia lipolytica]
MTSYIKDCFYSLSTCISCFPSPQLRINNRSFKIRKLLGEGGFAFVYLVETRGQELFALKKIRCPFGPESVQTAMREVDAYKTFDSPYIIKYVDSSVEQEADGSKSVYILLPYLKNGNLQDAINDHVMNGTHFSEEELMALVVEICHAIKALHQHRIGGDVSTTTTVPQSSYRLGDDEEQGLVAADELNNSANATPLSELVPYAHRDIKPANIMLSDNGRPILMDLGSCSRARIDVSSRQKALELQDMAAEQCSMPYRAPELFDVKTGANIDERVDVWSLGCTIYTLMYFTSPFEHQTNETGASLNLAIMNGHFTMPASPEYSDQLKGLVKKCLIVDPQERPFIDDVLKAASEEYREV